MKLFLCCFFFMLLILACSKATVLEADKPNVLKYANNVKLEIVEFQTGWSGASDGEMVVPTVKLKIKNIGSVKSTQENVIELRFYNSNEEWG
ncbi:MAG: hypothetical protein PHS59_18010, partial [Paludibacter sp.]|nr:hypothetical protein [Paludibacter sp.]